MMVFVVYSQHSLRIDSIHGKFYHLPSSYKNVCRSRSPIHLLVDPGGHDPGLCGRFLGIGF